MEIVGKTAGNKVVEESVKNAREAVRQGESIRQPLERAKVFPPMVVRMIGVGSRPGNWKRC